MPVSLRNRLEKYRQSFSEILLLSKLALLWRLDCLNSSLNLYELPLVLQFQLNQGGKKRIFTIYIVFSSGRLNISYIKKNYETYYRSARVQLFNKFWTILNDFEAFWTLPYHFLILSWSISIYLHLCQSIFVYLSPSRSN